MLVFIGYGFGHIFPERFDSNSVCSSQGTTYLLRRAPRISSVTSQKTSSTPVFLSFIMTVSSQCPSNVTRTSLTNLILPVMAFVNSPPPKNGLSLNSNSQEYPVFEQTILTFPPNSIVIVPMRIPLQ